MGGGYLYRVLLMLLVAPILLGFWLWGVRYLLARDPAAPRTVSVLLAWQRAAERGLLPGIALLVYACLRYLKPNYHPYTEADTTKALAYLEVSPAIRRLSRTQNALS
jgi:predicted metal-dependent hydrolase